MVRRGGGRSVRGLPFLCLLLLPVLPVVAGAEEFTGRVVGVTDGDTLKVLRNGRAEVVRLLGIDAPEKGQAYGQRAKEFTSALTFGKMVTVQAPERDRNGRLLGEVVLADGRNLSQELIRAGYAWWFRKYSRSATLARLETEARGARRGLWAERDPVPPWDFRQRPRRVPTGS